MKSFFPPELIREIAQGNVALLFGEEISVQAGVPSMEILMNQLARQIGRVERASPARIAQFYENRYGRHSLIQYLKEHLEVREGQSGLLSALLRLPLKVFIASTYDNLLENVLRRVDRPFDVVVVPVDMGYTSPERTQIYRLYGSLDKPDSLVITESEIESYSFEHPAVLQKLRDLLISHTFLVLGHAADDPLFRLAYQQVTQHVGEHRRSAYVVTNETDEFMLEDLRRRGLYVLPLATRGIGLKEALDSLAEHPAFRTSPHGILATAPVAKMALTTSPVRDLADKVSDLLQVQGYRVIEQEEISSSQLILYAQRQGLMTQRYLVLCVEGELQVPDIQILHRRLSQADRGVIISETRIAPSAQAYAKQFQHVDLLTFAGFYQRLIDLQPYVTRLLQEYEASPVPSFYVGLNCVKRRYDEAGTDTGFDRYAPVDTYLDAWLHEKGRNHISILGDFGTGKTWFCWHYAAKQARRYLDDPYHQRIPILISLRDYAKAYDIRQLITDLLVNRYHIPLEGGYQAFDKANQDGKLLIVFDGLDEMARRVGRETVVQNFWELAKVVGPNSKVMLTCRTAYFKTGLEEHQVLSGQRDGANYVSVQNRPNFEIVHIEEFNENQIREALRKRVPQDWERHYERIQSVYDLPNLAKRPVLLEMIMATLPELLLQQGQVNIAILYDTWTRRWLETNIESDRTLLTDAHKSRFFMQELAWRMYEEQQLSIHYSAIPERVRQYFGLVQAEDVDHFVHDVRTQTYLIRNEYGHYFFAHKSFMEFFVAKKLQEEIEAGTWSDFASMHLTLEVVGFLHLLLEDKNALWEAIERTKNMTEEAAGYLGGNAATVLALKGAQFAGRDFTGAKLSGAFFKNVELSACKFVNASLRDVEMYNCVMHNTDFSGADMTGFRMTGASGRIKPLDFSANDAHLATGGPAGVIEIWRTDTWEMINRLDLGQDYVNTLAFHPSGAFLAAGSNDQTVRIVRVQDGMVLRSLAIHRGAVESVAFSPTGDQFLTGAKDGTVKVVDFHTGMEVHRLLELSNYVRAVAYSLSGGFMAAADSTGQLYIWNRDFKPILTFACHHEAIHDVAFSPDSTRIATASSDGQVKIWRMYKEEIALQSILNGHQGFVFGVHFSPKGDCIASASWDKTIRVWDVESGKEIVRLTGHKQYVERVRFSGDGGLLASVGWDGKCLIWDTRTWKLLRTLELNLGGGDWTLMRGARFEQVRGVSLEKLTWFQGMAQA